MLSKLLSIVTPTWLHGHAGRKVTRERLDFPLELSKTAGLNFDNHWLHGGGIESLCNSVSAVESSTSLRERKPAVDPHCKSKVPLGFGLPDSEKLFFVPGYSPLQLA